MPVELIPQARMVRVVAYAPDTRDGVEREGRRREAVARQRLAGHRHDGHARITGRMQDVDYSVILDDDRGQQAAISIEYGRDAYVQIRPDGQIIQVGAMEGLRILRGAMAGGSRSVDLT